ncbi:hypothetical protein GGR56DRAFT_666823 [Xylariaceae sp. FL0804]|nr:hypothetical protein GGR56DRAFT_666823 [Xylariaceae sp. FL0804]
MALEAPLRSSSGSSGSILSAFSPHADMSVSSPESPASRQPFRPVSSFEPSSLRPSSAASASRPSSVPNQLASPLSDIVGPSPVTSVGTEVTEIDDEASDEAHAEAPSAISERQSQLRMLRTNIPDQVRKIANEESNSVIHAPQSFKTWAASDATSKRAGSSRRSSPKSSPRQEDMTTPPGNEPSTTKNTGTPTPPPLSTNIKPARFSIDSATPRAQDLDEVLEYNARIRSSSSSSLQLILESKEPETDAEPDGDDYGYEEYVTPVTEESRDDVEIRALKTALQECWTLCNTLASLSTHHRQRAFSTSGTPDGHERAWKSCWKLCQRLYDNRDEADESFNVKENLDLCRDFCQSLFDVRSRQAEVSDSVLRVSFELNNHLYSAQDHRTLPEAFRERTLDFYITLCHRLMKQRSDAAEETDSLLRACWTLAEMLFSLRQNQRNRTAPDEELLGSAVQACWELCDMFRAGWTQIRPERGTPKPSPSNYFFTYNREETDGRASRQSNRSKRDSMNRGASDKPRKKDPVPETPVTEFEDTLLSPDSEDSPQVPNIMVLGTDSSRGGRWSSSASNLSGYSQSSQRTSSTATTTTSADDVNITRVKVLILKAAMNMGFSRDAGQTASPPGTSGGGPGGAGGGGGGGGGAPSLQAFVKSLPAGAFGPSPAHAALLQHYRGLVTADSSFRQAAALPARGRRVLAADVAKSVGWMVLYSGGQYGFLRELFRLVFGFGVDEAEARKNVSIAV